MDTKVLFIVSGFRKGGAETQLIKIAKFLVRSHYDVRIISLKPINDFNVDFKKDGLDVVFLKGWNRNPFSNLALLFKTVDAFKPNVVVAFMFVSIIFARFLKMKYGFRLISTIRTPVISKKWHTLFKLTSDWDDIVVYNCNKSKENFEKNKLVKRNGLVINNAVSLPEKSENQISVLANSPFVWVCMAHFVPEKDYNTLFKAIALIKDRNFRVDILGNMLGQKWPFQMTKDLQIENCVNLLGLKTDTEPFLLNADGFVHSSFVEGMPNAVLEAMAYNKPIVATRVDGIEELLQDTNCGFLYTQGDAKELSEKMVLIMEMSYQERQSLGQTGQRHIEAHFAEGKVLKDWSSLIDQLVEEETTSIAAFEPKI